MSATSSPSVEDTANIETGSPTRPLVLHARVVTGHGGGPEKTILNSPRFLEEHGYDAVCAYMRPPGDEGFDVLRKKAAELGAPLVELDDRGAWDLGVVRRMAAVCRERGVDIYHGHDYKSNALGLLLRKFHPMRLVTTVHGWVKFTKKTPLYYKIDRMCLRRFERVICVSDDLVEQCLAAGVPSDRCELIHNAIDTEQFRRTESPAEAKARLGFAPDRLLIGAMGRLSEEKGFNVLIQAVDRLIREGAAVDLVIIGEGDQQLRLAKLIGDLGQDEHIRLLGYRTDGPDLYSAMDVFALSSLREGLPNVVLEAMAMETPVVATRVAGVPRLVQHEQTGLLVEPDDETALAAALARVARDAELRHKLRTSARAAIERDYSFAARMSKVCMIYDELIKTPR